ncbi:hypothetical protein [Aeromicrobium endophyticum]|uniref:Peptidase MA-like domain-containing protein n=1 Tax=Aeromicrobium endophyticum TaxID=2292704 RepID=A0A371P3D6_9ACTN|nr:hypothetical protein [Aeromicrobium endophyticum]REK70431.1 hypothetical protein DX116_14930 [Aeromicrobium endophyticum]
MAAAVVLAVLAAALLAWQQPWRDDASDGPATAVIPRDASTRLTSQLRALSDATSEQQFVAAAGDLPAGRDFGRRTWRSLRAVAQPGATFRYVSGGEVADRADGSATATVDVSWRATARSGLDPEVTRTSTVRLRVAPAADGDLSLVGAAPADGGVPLWLLGAVTVDVEPGRAVIRVGGGDAAVPIDEMVTSARAAVERTVRGVGGDLTIVSPHSQAQMAALLGQDEAAVAQVAAVTTGIDGDETATDPVVVLNPAVFATMDRRAAQVVLTHEATHVLTSAVGTTAVNWVVEGFADYVALRDDTAPLSVSAGQILAEVRAGRVPRALPTDADFGSTQHGLGAVYESTWMVFRMLGEQHPPTDVVAFYRDVLGGEPVDRALRARFGLSVAELTSDWQAYLTKSASTVS